MKSLDELKNAIKKFNTDRDWGKYHTPKNLSVAVGVEAAELQEIFMWLTPEESIKVPKEVLAKIEDEVGDILICLVNFSAQLGIDPLEAASRKLIKNHAKYPVDKSRGHARKYDQL